MGWGSGARASTDPLPFSGGMGRGLSPWPSELPAMVEDTHDEHRGLGRFMTLTETRAPTPRTPVRLPDVRLARPGAVDSTGAAYGYEGLYCIDSSIIPTSLGVNPSLTI